MTEILCGVHAVVEALKAARRRVHEVWATRVRAAEARAAIGSARLPVHEVTAEMLAKVSGTGQHQGIAARVDPFPYTPLDALIRQATADPRGAFFVVLDQVQDPQNVGSVIRTALCAGAHGLILPKDNAASVTPTVCRAAAGATEYLPIGQVTNVVETIKSLKSQNIWIVGADGSAKQTIYEYRFDGGHAIVMGTEGKGLRRLVREHCDILLSIPIAGSISSYNVSAASAMILGEMMRQRLVGKTS